MANHKHSYWLDFTNDQVRCSGIGCKHVLKPGVALILAWPELTLEKTESLLKDYQGKVYVVCLYGEYLCTITGYTRGVLHLLDFKNDGHFETFKKAVSECFGVLHIETQKEKENV